MCMYECMYRDMYALSLLGGGGSLCHSGRATVYVCMYICMYECMNVYVLRVCMYVYICMYVCGEYLLRVVVVFATLHKPLCMYVCMYVCMYCEPLGM